ncbi:MAG TPA: RidA family protein [Acidobacteriaceae bacterium]|nr:RidA family protein [Acidobacteriaceae bacterium]
MRYPLRCCPCAVLGFLLAAGTTQLLAQAGGTIKVIKVDGNHIGTASSAGILVNRTLYVAGQNGRNSNGEVPKDFQKEVRQSLDHVRGVLRAAGMDFGNVVWMNIYLTHSSDMSGMNQVYWKMMGTETPARTVLGVANLPHGENIEINCIAVSSAAHRRVIHPPGWPQGPRIDPAGIEADDVLYMSAQGGVDPLTGKVAADYAGEVKQALDNVAAVVKAANMSMANVIWVNPYLSTDAGPEHVMNKIYASYFEFGNTPGRGTIQVVELPNHAHVVFSCIAGADLSKRMSIRPRNEKPSPTASPGILYRDTLYLSAKDAYVPALGLFSPELGIQVRMSMRSLLDGLQKADMDFSNVVSSTIYLRDVRDDDPIVSLYAMFFKHNFPARTTLQQNFDTKSEDVEQISFIAVRQPLH